MNKMKIVLATLVALFATVALSAQTLEEVHAEYNKAAELVGAGNVAEAIPILNKVVEMGVKAGPDAMETVTNAQKLLPKCYFSKGMGLAKAGKLEEAISDFTSAAQTGELHGDIATMNKAKSMISQAYTMLAANAFNAKDYAKAAEIFAKGYAANPKDTKLGLNLAMSYCEMAAVEDKAKGYDIYKDIIALEATHSKYAEAAATAKEKYAYYKMLEAAKAAEAKDADAVYALVNEIMTVDPTNATAGMMALQTATNVKNFDKVIEMGEKVAATQVTPALKADAYFLLGAAYQNKENKAEAIKAYQKVTTGNNVATAKAQITALSK